MSIAQSTENKPRTGVPRLPELLAPAGDWECAKAAVENGADAIYFGLERFNARMRAHNFTEAALVIETLFPPAPILVPCPCEER